MLHPLLCVNVGIRSKTCQFYASIGNFGQLAGVILHVGIDELLPVSR